MAIPSDDCIGSIKSADASFLTKFTEWNLNSMQLGLIYGRISLLLSRGDWR